MSSNKSTLLDEHYQETYDAEAAIYDQDRFGSTNRDYACRYKNKVLLDVLKANGITGSDKKILDLPSGTGRIAHELLAKTECHVTAADISPGMLEKNKGSVDKMGGASTRITYQVANMKELPFEDHQYDAVTMASFFYLIPQREYPDYIADAVRVLKPGGIVIAEFSNAAAIFNPITQFKIFAHRFIRRKPIKSYPYVWELGKLNPQLKFEKSYGTEYPRLFKAYETYEKLSGVLGRSPLLKMVGGKITAVFRKLDD